MEEEIAEEEKPELDEWNEAYEAAVREKPNVAIRSILSLQSGSTKIPRPSSRGSGNDEFDDQTGHNG